MEILVRKPTEREIEEMKSKPVWTCGVSRFDWFYDSEEICFIIEGEVVVEYGGSKNVTITEGDYVVFPRGLSCVWDVKKPIKKHYEFK